MSFCISDVPEGIEVYIGVPGGQLVGTLLKNYGASVALKHGDGEIMLIGVDSMTSLTIKATDAVKAFEAKVARS